MKIVQTPPRIFTPGGVERYVADLSSELIRRGHDVRVFCSADGIPGERQDRIPIQALKTCCRIGNTPITPALPFRLWQQDFDIIHTHLPTPWSADWSGIVARQKKKPLVVTYHSSLTGKGVVRSIADFYNKTAFHHLLRSADGIIVARESFLPPSLQGFREKIVCIPIGVDVSRFYPEVHTISADVFFLAVLDKYHGFKGLDTLLAAIRIVKEKIPSIRLIVGGGGSMLTHYEQMAGSLGLSANIRFLGFIHDEALRHCYNRSRVFVLPSRSPELETFGIVLLEAMACARPVVTTKIAGMADDISRSGAGIVVNQDDPGELANAILAILLDESLERRMGKNGLLLVREKYQWQSVAERVEQLYKDIM